MKFGRALLLALPLVSSCALQEPAVAPWLGTWTFLSGVQSATCPGASGNGDIIVSNVVVTAGDDSDTIVTLIQSQNCRVVWHVNGSNATIESGQHCQESAMGNLANVAWSVSTSGAELQNSILTLDLSGAGPIGGGGGCAFSEGLQFRAGT